jgi:uncharacterized protein YcbX
MPTVARLNVTPVKSTRLHHPHQARLETHGAVGNREFFFVDAEGRRFPGLSKTPLLALDADHDPVTDRLVIRLPDGTVAEGSASIAGEALTVDFYGRPVEAHVVEGDWNAAVSRLAGTAVRLARADRPGDASDVRPVTIVSLASVAELSRQGGREEPVDAARFRMTIELEGCAPHEEDTWEGRRARVGDALLLVEDPVPRCVVTTLDPNTGVRDFPTLTVIKDYRGVTPDGDLLFGVYASVLEPGTARVGDALELL